MKTVYLIDSNNIFCGTKLVDADYVPGESETEVPIPAGAYQPLTFDQDSKAWVEGSKEEYEREHPIASDSQGSIKKGLEALQESSQLHDAAIMELSDLLFSQMALSAPASGETTSNVSESSTSGVTPSQN